MSEILREERYGIPVWAWVLTSFGTIVTAGYLLYSYFVAPGEMILRHYEEILSDIYKETKEFLYENAALPTPIYGLTAVQEEIITAKEKSADELRPQVEKILEVRQLPVAEWVTTVIVGLLGIYAAKEILPELLDKLHKWRAEQKTASSTLQSSHGHIHLVMQLLENELAFSGRTDIAGGFAATMQRYYAAYTAPTLEASILAYNALIPTLVQGSMAWIVATHMLTYMTYEASATTGIMALMWAWWLPPLI